MGKHKLMQKTFLRSSTNAESKIYAGVSLLSPLPPSR